MPIIQNWWVGEPGEPSITGEPVTSELYPISVGPEEIDIGHAFGNAGLLAWPIDEADVSHNFESGVLTLVLRTYTDWPAEPVDIFHDIPDAVLTLVLKIYADWPPEPIDVFHDFPDAVLTLILKTYVDWPVESVDVSHTFTDAVLA